VRKSPSSVFWKVHFAHTKSSEAFSPQNSLLLPGDGGQDDGSSFPEGARSKADGGSGADTRDAVAEIRDAGADPAAETRDASADPAAETRYAGADAAAETRDAGADASGTDEDTDTGAAVGVGDHDKEEKL